MDACDEGNNNNYDRSHILSKVWNVSFYVQRKIWHYRPIVHFYRQTWQNTENNILCAHRGWQETLPLRKPGRKSLPHNFCLIHCVVIMGFISAKHWRSNTSFMHYSKTLQYRVQIATSKLFELYKFYFTILGGPQPLKWPPDDYVLQCGRWCQFVHSHFTIIYRCRRCSCSLIRT